MSGNVLSNTSDHLNNFMLFVVEWYVSILVTITTNKDPNMFPIPLKLK